MELKTNAHRRTCDLTIECKNWIKITDTDFNYFELDCRNNRKGGTASLRSRTCVKRNVVFGARFKGLSLYFLYQKGTLIRIKMGLDTYLIRIQTPTPCDGTPLTIILGLENFVANGVCQEPQTLDIQGKRMTTKIRQKYGPNRSKTRVDQHFWPHVCSALDRSILLKMAFLPS